MSLTHDCSATSIDAWSLDSGDWMGLRNIGAFTEHYFAFHCITCTLHCFTVVILVQWDFDLWDFHLWDFHLWHFNYYRLWLQPRIRYLEHVQAIVSLLALRRGDIDIALISPGGDAVDPARSKVTGHIHWRVQRLGVHDDAQLGRDSGRTVEDGDTEWDQRMWVELRGYKRI